MSLPRWMRKNCCLEVEVIFLRQIFEGFRSYWKLCYSQERLLAALKQWQKTDWKLLDKASFNLSIESQEPIRIRNEHESCLQVRENSTNTSRLFLFLNRILIGVEISVGTLSQSQSLAARNRSIVCSFSVQSCNLVRLDKTDRLRLRFENWPLTSALPDSKTKLQQMNRICICQLQLQVRERDIQGLGFIKKTEAKIYPHYDASYKQKILLYNETVSNCTRTTDSKQALIKGGQNVHV